MYSVYGNIGCGRCEVVKNILKQKGIEFEYKLLNDLSSEDRQRIMGMAREVNKLSLPIIIKDGKVLTLEEV